jgi:transposase
MGRKRYPSDVSDEEWSFVASYLSLMNLAAPQRAHDLRDVFDALRWLVRKGAAWQYLPGDFPPWEAVYQQTQRWLRAEAFEKMAHDLRELVRLAQERDKEPSAAGWTVARCRAHPRVDTGRALMVTNASVAQKYTRR